MTRTTPPGGPGEAPEGCAHTRAALEIRNLSISYRATGGDVLAVRGVDLDLHVGEVLGLVGESGSGKSTLGYGACRLLRPPAVITGGSVVYRGRRGGGAPIEVLNQSPRELRALRWREISIVFQSAMNALNPVLRIRDQIDDVLRAHLDIGRAERIERTAGLLDMVGIPRGRLKSYPHELSGGMRQRVMIAMALAVEPEIVIMDEPTTALDVVLQREILAEIAELRSRLDFGILFITHDLSLLLEIADRVAVMYAGRLVEVGTAAEIHHEPAHPYTRGLLNSFPRVRGRRRELAGIPGSPPDLRTRAHGCSFAPRCPSRIGACLELEMRLDEVPDSAGGHVTACPFTLSTLAGSTLSVSPPEARRR